MAEDDAFYAPPPPRVRSPDELLAELEKMIDSPETPHQVKLGAIKAYGESAAASRVTTLPPPRTPTERITRYVALLASLPAEELEQVLAQAELLLHR